MMASFWPTQMALDTMPDVARGMNKAEKIVFSTTLKSAEWNNTRLIKENMVAEVKKMKQKSDKDMVVLGSGSIVTQLAEHGLVDVYQLMIDPVALGSGTPIFKNLARKLDLKLSSSRTFKSGVIVLNYEPLGH
jgi:dihydrofolate reductase